MEQTKINHSPLITAVEKFVEETIKRQRRWKGYWVELVELLNEMQEEYDPDLWYSAYNGAMIALMLDLEQNLEASQDISTLTLKGLTFSDVQSRFRKFERQHKREVQKFIEDELANRRKAIIYTELLLEHYLRLMVLRCDLSYRMERRPFIDISDFRKHIRKLLDRLQDRDRHLKDLQGYIYALEQGTDKGYHAHFLFFYDASKVESDRYHVDLIIDTWKEITDEEGSGHNCNTKQNRDSFKAQGKDALGCIYRGDESKKANIMEIVRYFTKPSKTEQYLRVKVKNMQTFGHGKFHKPSRRGTAHTVERVMNKMRLERIYSPKC